VPPIEEDELISSWLARVARFYGHSVFDLLDENGLDSRKVDLSAVDIGLTEEPLAPLAGLLNAPVSTLAEHTIASAYPWAVNGVARECGDFSFGTAPPLRPAVCPWCLEEQKSTRGFSWLRREWVIAGRTMCSRHGIRLIEGGEAAVGPRWEDFFKRHPRVQQATCAGSVTSTIFQWVVPKSSTNPIERLNERLLQVQNILAADPKRKDGVGDDAIMLALMIDDVLWALTRADRAFPERLVYEAFALQVFESDWHLVRRRSIAPADYTRFGVRVRHSMMASAAAVAGDENSLFGLCLPRFRSHNEIAFLLSILTKPDANELVLRSGRWPERLKTALLEDHR
jgi:hypothetical protein